MCGLIGMAGTLELKHKNAMKDMFFLDTLRGKDSTGLSAVSRDRFVSTRKYTVPGYDFIELPAVNSAMKHGDQLWIGHNRYKTTGDVSKANAHPFEVVDEEDGGIILVGAHNGTLTNKWELEREMKGKKFQTDSEALFNLFVEAKDFKSAIGMLKGAWSLVWWDPMTDSLHFCRNDQRPLTYAFTKDNKAIVWASEPWMIINACRRNGVELAQNNNGLSCYTTSIDTLYTLEIPQKADEALPELKKEGGYVGAPDRVFHAGFHGGYGREHFREWWNVDGEAPVKPAARTEQKGSEKVGEKAEKSEPAQNVVLGFPSPRRFKGVHLKDEDIAEIKDKGCGWCGDPFLEKEAYEFLEVDRFCCLNCVRDKHPVVGDWIPSEDPLDDPLPFEEGDFDEGSLEIRPGGLWVKTDTGSKWHSKDSEEYKRLVETAASTAKKIIG